MIKIIKLSVQKNIEEVDSEKLFLLDLKPEEHIWIFMEKPDDIIEKNIFNKFNIHPLLFSDVHRGKNIDEESCFQHNPKVEDFGHYLFVIFHKIEALENKITFRQKQLNVFLGSNFIITLTYEKFHSLNKSFEIIKSNPVYFEKGPDFIFHLILDEIVGKTLPYLENIEDELDRIEMEVFKQPAKSTLNSILQIKKILSRFRRISFYQKEILFRLSHGEFELITRDESIFYRDVYDHLLRSLDLIESFHERISGLMDAYLSSVSNKLNEIMKVLTIITTIMMPLSFIAGIYGMNFKYMPELDWILGYPMALILMLITALIMILFFKRKKWF